MPVWGCSSVLQDATSISNRPVTGRAGTSRLSPRRPHELHRRVLSVLAVHAEHAVAVRVQRNRTAVRLRDLTKTLPPFHGVGRANNKAIPATESATE